MENLISYVDPFIGVEGRGHCLCGPYLPLSLVRLGPDTLIPHPNNGYDSHHPIIRFSHTHVSGTGGAGDTATSALHPLPANPELQRTPLARKMKPQRQAITRSHCNQQV